LGKNGKVERGGAVASVAVEELKQGCGSIEALSDGVGVCKLMGSQGAVCAESGKIRFHWYVLQVYVELPGDFEGLMVSFQAPEFARTFQFP